MAIDDGASWRNRALMWRHAVQGIATIPPMSEIVQYEVRGRTGIITLNRPEARNAVNAEVADGIETAIDAIESNRDVWVGVIRSNIGEHSTAVFCAGADLKAIAAGARTQTRRGGFAGFVYRDRVKPVVAAVDGLATAGGCEIALAADIVVATTRSSFGAAEVKRNLIAGAGGLFRLPRAIGQWAAMEMLLTGEPIPAERAYALGMVSRLVEPGQAFDSALDIAERIAAAGPLAVQATRRVVLAAAYEDDVTLKQMSLDEFAAVLATEDTKEGVRAFMEKRSPNWQGR